MQGGQLSPPCPYETDEELFKTQWLFAPPIGNRVYVDVGIRRQSVQQVLEPEANGLGFEVLGVVGGPERLKIPMRRDPVADAHANIVVWSSVSRSLVEGTRAQLRSIREERRRIIGQILDAQSSSDFVFESMMTRKPGNRDRCKVVLLGAEVSSLA